MVPGDEWMVVVFVGVVVIFLITVTKHLQRSDLKKDAWLMVCENNPSWQGVMETETACVCGGKRVRPLAHVWRTRK